MNKPNFFVIGAGRSGTTSLYNYLQQHPDVFMSPIKETNFFAYNGEAARSLMGNLAKKNPFPVVTIEDYLALFRGASGKRAIGEASPLYLHSPHAAQRIKEFAAAAKLIAVLRHPADRAYSSYYLHARDRREPRTFDEAIRQERAGIEDRSLTRPQRQYLRLGLYSQYLLPYFEIFERTQLAIYLFDDLKADPQGLMRKLFRFLDVADDFVPDTSHRYNAGGVAPNRFWQTLLTKNRMTAALGKRLPVWARHRALKIQDTARSRRLVKPQLPPETRQELTEFYRSDILKLENLIQRDLSAWLK
jgi:hypothetical protein